MQTLASAVNVISADDMSHRKSQSCHRAPQDYGPATPPPIAAYRSRQNACRPRAGHVHEPRPCRVHVTNKLSGMATNSTTCSGSRSTPMATNTAISISMTLSELVGEIDSNRQQGNLSSAIRLFVLDYFRTRA